MTDLPRFRVVPLALVALAVMAAHLLVIDQYGIFRDEFYYLACGRHLAWGYVEHPPGVALIARLTSAFGDSPLAIRLFPLLGSGALVFIVGAIARRMGGAAFAQVVAAATVSIAPHFLFVFHVLSMNFAEVLLWSLGAWLVLVALQDEAGWAWVAFGAVAGAGLLTKHSMGLYGAGIFAGLLLTHEGRRALRTPWPWLGGVMALALFSPHVWWQVRHDWPLVEFVRNAQREKIAETSLGGFFVELILMMNPFAVVLVALGLWFLLVRHDGRPHAVLGWAFLVVVLVFATQRSKAYYATPAFPPVLAAGAVLLERLGRRAAWRHAVAAVVLLGALPAAPMALPILAPDRLAAYMRSLGVAPSSGERHELGVLPQHFADMHGWEELARGISGVYQGLPEHERATARVFARNYGQAGSLEYFAARYPMPRVISSHNSYWYWGPGPDDGGVVIVIGGPADELREFFTSVEEVARTACGYCMPYENDRPIFVARGWKVPLSTVWSATKRFI